MSINITIPNNLFSFQKKDQSFSYGIHLTINKLGVYILKKHQFIFLKVSSK